MTLTTIRSPPALDSFTPLVEHQSQTPTSFFGAKPVLYQHIIGARGLISRDQASKLPLFQATDGLSNDEITAVDPADGAGGEERPPVVTTVDVFVSSENLTIFNPSNSTGLSISYPAISLHAIQRLPSPDEPGQEMQGLYMQLEIDSELSSEEEEEAGTIELTIISPTSLPSVAEGPQSIKALFEAVSACSNLHPDSNSQEDEDMLDDYGDSRIIFEGNVGYDGISGLPGVVQGASDGGLPPPFPGSGGWITAENVGEYFDEDGNWIGGEQQGETLGEGAGRVRQRDEVESGEEQIGGDTKVNGHDSTEEDHKRPRTE